jgi:hypothetical protein
MKHKDIKINGATYTVTELRMRDVLPLMNGEGAENLSVDLAKRSIHLEGKPLGEAFLDLPMSTGQKLMELVNEVNGFGANEGN